MILNEHTRISQWLNITNWEYTRNRQEYHTDRTSQMIGNMGMYKNTLKHMQWEISQMAVSHRHEHIVGSWAAFFRSYKG